MRDGAGGGGGAVFRLRAGGGFRPRAGTAALPSGVRVWDEPVPYDSGCAAAVRRRERELRRPPGPSAPYRVVLLRYADGVTDVVVTARGGVDLGGVVRGAVPGVEGGAVTDARGSGVPDAGGGGVPGAEDSVAPDAEAPGMPDAEGPGMPRAGDALAPDVSTGGAGTPPPWGFGRPGSGPERHTVAVHFTEPTGERLSPLLSAAVEFVLSRYEGGAPDDHTVADALGAGARARPTSGVALAHPAPAPTGGPGADLIDHLPYRSPPHPLTICPVTGPDTGTLTLHFLHRADWCAPEAVQRFARHLTYALRQLADSAPDRPLADLELLDADERAHLLAADAPCAPGPRQGATLPALFAEQAARHPDRPAVVCDGDPLTYRQVDLRARRIAAGLRAAGAGPGTRVGVCLDRSADLPVVLLAVLRTGAAYVPLDPSQPPDRLRYLIRDAAPVLMVGGPEHVPDGLEVPRHDVADLLGGSDEPAPDAGSADDPAYVIYTSGSTGKPKGVVVPHRNVTALVDATADDFGLTPDDVWTMFHSAAFDFSVWEMWGCLLTGGCLVVVPYWVSRAPDDFRALLAGRGVTVLSQTPSAFGQLARADEEFGRRGDGTALALRLVVFGGEPLDTRALLPWFDRHPPSRCRLVNMYGITETTVHVTAHTVTRADALAGSRSVGRALPGWRVRVADARGGPLPVGVAGEIHVSGAGLALGYHQRPELTAERFVTDPDTGRRGYRSGDRGRLLPDGTLEHLGRLDAQIQLRGFRVELGEVRAALLDHPRVRDAAVTVAGPGTESARLDAYVVLAPDADGRGALPIGASGAGELAADIGLASDMALAADIRRVAARFLPEYMVPSTVTPLSALPLTANGKLDAARLPPPTRAVAPAPTQASMAAGVDEERGALLLSLWADLFDTPVGLDDNFFALGGNSLLAVRLSAALRERALPDVSVRDLYRAPTVRGLLQFLTADTDGTDGTDGAPARRPTARPARRGRLLDLP
ncbi:amino acid adenylation domain-containing protein [Streptomyces sp. NPDC059063]|uniref:amino acid adenylation domain-containing protein n=1 Tax=unclassified Streptomyces TaxID=2593676 RepID=UPI0036BD137E